MEQKDRKILEFTNTLNHLFDIEEILDLAIKEMPVIINAQRVSIYLADDEEKNWIPKRHSSKKLQGYIEKVPYESNASLIPQVIIKKKSLLIPDVREYIEKNSLDIVLSKRQRYTSGSCMLVPVVLKIPPEYNEKIIGVINIAEKMDFTLFTKYDLVLAEQLGEILGTSIHNCKIVEKKLGGKQKELMNELQNVKEAFAQKEIKLDEAKKKQFQMLPEMPEIPNYDLFTYYSPMETIGGDFYDFININDHEIGIVLGDVSGHGIEAALVMSMAKQILNIYCRLHKSLIKILSYANDEISANLKGESFVAVFLGILNTKTNTLRYVRAGQTYPLLYNPKREIAPSEVKSRGVVLGTMRGNLFKKQLEEKEIKFMPNDILLMYTDGIIEAQDKNEEEFSVERVVERLVKYSKQTAKDMSYSIKDEVSEFTDNIQSDDITLFCLKVGEIKNEEESFNAVTIAEEYDDFDSFLVPPMEEDYNYQIINLENRISELEDQMLKEQKEKTELQVQCFKLQEEIDLAANDPESLIVQLREQLKIATELPRDLILENKSLHEEIEKQRQELRKFEGELNELISNSKFLESECKTLREREKESLKNAKDLFSSLDEELGNATKSYTQLQDKLKDGVEEKDYQEIFSYLQKMMNLSFEQMDFKTFLFLQKLIFNISGIFLDNYKKLKNDLENTNS